jgi:predicted phage terminase large subunit-like protein
MNGSNPSLSESGIGSPSEIRLLSPEEIDALSLEESVQYEQLLAEYERRLDMEDLAAGLTADLSTFMRQAWNVIEPETPLVWDWSYEYLCSWLELIASGEFKKRYPEKLGIIINQPPRSGKSLFTSVNFPVWAWLKYPGRRFLFGSHSLKLAIEHNYKRARLINSLFFQERFGDRFKLEAEGAFLLRNDRAGQFLVTSIGAKATGFGGMICIGDDLLDREDAFSATVKTSTNSWIDSSFSKMLDDQVRGVFVHISQRLAIDDPTGHLMGEDGSTGKPEQWIHIKIKREAGQEEVYNFPDGKRRFVRPKGDILQAERCPPNIVTRLKLKSREWANQEQQEPTPMTGALLNPNWLRGFRGSSPLPTFFQVILSVDCNFKEGRENDLVAIHKYAIVYNRRYLLDRDTRQIGYIATKQRIREMARGGEKVSWLSVPMPAATQVLIENKANGPAVTEELRADPEFKLAVIDYNPLGSKTQRFIAATGDAEAGLVYFPDDAPWIGPLKKILCDYAGEGSIPHDDDCDAWSQAINWSRQQQYGFLAYVDKLNAEAVGNTGAGPVRCLVKDENARDLVLEWDDGKRLWFDPKNPERTYPAGPDPADA